MHIVRATQKRGACGSKLVSLRPKTMRDIPSPEGLTASKTHKEVIEQMATELKVEDFLEYIKQSPSKGTYKEYKAGIKKFSGYYGKTPDETLKERSQDWTSGDLHQIRRFT